MRDELTSLVLLFEHDPDQLGSFAETNVSAMPRDDRMLLAHRDHMTDTTERYHNCQVNVEILAKRRDAEYYSRKILLRRQTDRAVVLYGIVRINMGYLSEEVREKIESERVPLGRILVHHNVLRDVHLQRLWRVELGPELQQVFGVSGPAVTYGRTAVIYCDGKPAIELLEIVSPAGETE